MKNPLNKRLPRELRSSAGKYLSIFFLLTATIVIGSSFLSVMESVRYTLTKNQEESYIEDGQFETYQAMPFEALSHLQDLSVTVVPNPYITIDEYENTTKVLLFSERTKLNLPALFEGCLPQTEQEIALDRLFAKNHELQVGDTLTLDGEAFLVSGILSLPDYNSLFKSNSDFVMDTTTFGVCVLSPEGFARFPETKITYRYSYRFDEELTEKESRDKADDILQSLLEDGIALQSFLTAENNQSITYLSNDMGSDGPVMNAFLYILIGIVAFVFAVLTGNTIDAESAIIGTLRSMGYKKGEILLHYITPTALISIFSSVLGNLLGYTVMTKPFEEIYYTSYCLPPLQLKFNTTAFLLTTVVPVFIMLVINFLMLSNKLSLSPLRFLRGDLKKGKQKHAVKLPPFSFLSRFRLRVILQNKGNYFVLFFGIFLSSFLLMFGLGLRPLIQHYVDEIDDSIPYEYQYILKAPTACEGGEKVSLAELNTFYPLGQKNINVTFMGISEDSQFYPDLILPDTPDKAVISDTLAKKLNLQPGDDLTFTDTYGEKEYCLTVDSIYEYNGNLTVFMQADLLNRMFEKEDGYFNSYLSNKKLDLDEQYIAKYITRADMLGAAKQMTLTFRELLNILSAFSVAIYMILMYLLTKTVIEKNAIHISFMKIFGYSPREIGKLYLNAGTIVVLISLFICLPLEVFCFKYILVYISSMFDGYMEFYLPLRIYLEIIGIGAAAYFIINSFHIRKVRNIPMGLALKNRE